MKALLILTLLLAHPAWSDRGLTLEERANALRPVAESILEATRDPKYVSVLIALGRHESNFQTAVVFGRCWALGPTQHCDHGESRGVWQLKRAACAAAYLWPAGSAESMHAEALCVVRLIHGYEARCGRLAGAFAMFATGHSCAWSGALVRVATVAHVQAELARAGGQS